MPLADPAYSPRASRTRPDPGTVFTLSHEARAFAIISFTWDGRVSNDPSSGAAPPLRSIFQLLQGRFHSRYFIRAASLWTSCHGPIRRRLALAEALVFQITLKVESTVARGYQPRWVG